MTTIQETFALLLIARSLVLIYFLQPILAPFLTSIIIGYLGDPLVDRLEAMRVNRTVGVLIVFPAVALFLPGLI